jgi:hypothetical protein
MAKKDSKMREHADILSVDDLVNRPTVNPSVTLAADPEVATLGITSMPLSVAYGNGSPRLSSPWHRFHYEAIKVMTGKYPRAFERAAAEALWEAFDQMPTHNPVSTFTALSAATPPRCL